MWKTLKEMLTSTHMPESLGAIGNQYADPYNSLVQQQTLANANAMLAQHQQNILNQNLWAQGLQQGLFGGTPRPPKFDPTWRVRYEIERAAAAEQREVEWT